MEKQQFKLIAKSNIDEIEERIEDLKNQFEKIGGINLEYELKIEQLELKKASLIEQYNNIDSIFPEKWEKAMNSFTSARDILSKRIDYISINNIASNY